MLLLLLWWQQGRRHGRDGGVGLGTDRVPGIGRLEPGTAAAAAAAGGRRRLCVGRRGRRVRTLLRRPTPVPQRAEGGNVRRWGLVRVGRKAAESQQLGPHAIVAGVQLQSLPKSRSGGEGGRER